MDIAERKALRHDLMVELYNHYFEGHGPALHLTKDDLLKDKEKDLAYQYLIAKGFIKGDQQGQHFYFRPTAIGIDHVENN